MQYYWPIGALKCNKYTGKWIESLHLLCIIVSEGTINLDALEWMIILFFYRFVFVNLHFPYAERLHLWNETLTKE